MGDAYANGRRYDEAHSWYQKAIQLDSNRSAAYISRGLAYVGEGANKYGAAQEAFRKAIEVAPEAYAGYWQLGLLCESRERWREAAYNFGRVADVQPEFRQYALAKVGRMQCKMGDLQSAEASMFEALQLDPTIDLGTLLDLTRDYEKAGNTAEALRVFRQIRKVKGDSDEASHHNRLGNFYYTKKEYDTAAQHYSNAVDTDQQTVVYYSNFVGALRQLRDWKRIRGFWDRTAADIRKDEGFCGSVSSAWNDEANEEYEKGDYGRAIELYAEAIALDPKDAVLRSNLAGAWEHNKSIGSSRLDFAISAMQEACRLAPDNQEHAHKLERLRTLQRLEPVFGKNVSERMPVVTPIAVEVARDMIPLIEGDGNALSADLKEHIEAMRSGILARFGVRIPGIRFRGNEADLPLRTYIIMINEIPLVSGSLSVERKFCLGSEEAFSRLDIKGDAGSDPASGREGIWIERKDWKKVESDKFEVWGVTQYLTRHLEAVVRRNISEFLGHQEIVNLLGSGSGSLLEEIRASSSMTTALTTVCKALLAEEVPIQPFQELCACFKDLYVNSVGLRDIVEHIRALSSFRERLPGNDGQHRVLKLSARFEEEIRRSLYTRDGRSVLAMEPERCQHMLTAVRNEVSGQCLALVTNDSVLRPFVRKLVELEFPNLPVLSQSELRPGNEFASASTIDLDSEPATGKLSFRTSLRADTTAVDSDKNRTGTTLALSDMRVEVVVSETFETQAQGADDEPMSEMLSMMQDGLFYELGIILPEVQVHNAPNLKSSEFRIRLNGEEQGPVSGLGPDEFLVNDTVDRLRLLGIEGRKENNPANGSECAIVRETQGQTETCTKTGLTVWGPRGYLVLRLSSEIRKSAARFQTDDATKFILDSLGEAFPDLVRAALQRYTLTQISGVLRELLAEDISIRDLRSILESLLFVDGTTNVDLRRFIVFCAYTDGLCPDPAARNTSDLTVAQLTDFVRASLKRYISHKYTRGGNTLVVYLMDPAIEQRIGEAGERVLTEAEEKELLAAIGGEVGSLPPTASLPVLLTSFEVRRALRRLVQREYPQLAVVSYQELSPDMNIQPIARISWSAPTRSAA